MTVLNISELKVHGLQPVSFSVDKELVCMSGPSGSGKSLLLRAITDLIEHQGEVYLDNTKCSTTNPVTWRQWVGLLPAESAWWQDRVGDHFKENKPDYLEEREP